MDGKRARAGEELNLGRDGDGEVLDVANSVGTGREGGRAARGVDEPLVGVGVRGIVFGQGDT